MELKQHAQASAQFYGCIRICKSRTVTNGSCNHYYGFVNYLLVRHTCLMDQSHSYCLHVCNRPAPLKQAVASSMIGLVSTGPLLWCQNCFFYTHYYWRHKQQTGWQVHF